MPPICFSPILAQIDADLKVTTGGIVAGLLVLSTLVGSLAMIVIWYRRCQQRGHAFPLAHRQPLCVPQPVMVCGIVLSFLMATLVFQQPDSQPPAPTEAQFQGDVVGLDAASINEQVELPTEAQFREVVVGTMLMMAGSPTPFAPKAP